MFSFEAICAVYLLFISKTYSKMYVTCIFVNYLLIYHANKSDFRTYVWYYFKYFKGIKHST